MHSEATLTVSTGALVTGMADRAAYDAGDEYIRVSFYITDGGTEIHRSRVSFN